MKIFNVVKLNSWESKIDRIVSRMVELDYCEMEGLTKEAEGTVEQWANITRLNYKNLYIACDDKLNIVGYINWVIIGKDIFDKIISGELNDSELSPSNVITYEEPGEYSLYIISICIDKEYQKQGLGTKLYQKISERIKECSENRMKINNIVALGYTKAGCEFLEKHGFKLVCKHHHRGNVYINKLL